MDRCASGLRCREGTHTSNNNIIKDMVGVVPSFTARALDPRAPPSHSPLTSPGCREGGISLSRTVGGGFAPARGARESPPTSRKGERPRGDSNAQPTPSKGGALSIELRGPVVDYTQRSGSAVPHPTCNSPPSYSWTVVHQRFEKPRAPALRTEDEGPQIDRSERSAAGYREVNG